jgi:hydrogenase maturation protease
MNFQAADAIVKAVLYEGYLLYPYRPTSIKNRQRWSFGGLYPVGCECLGAAQLHTQCLVEGHAHTRIEARVRFLQPMARRLGELSPPLLSWSHDREPPYRPVETLSCDGRSYYSWDESVERELTLPAVSIGELATGVVPLEFAWPAIRTLEPIAATDGRICGVIVRSQAAVTGRVTLAVDQLAAGAWRLTACIENTTTLPAAKALPAATLPAATLPAATLPAATLPAATPLERDAAQLAAFLSTHVILGAQDGAFVSLIDPPEPLAQAARSCVNQNAWPVLVGDEGARDTLLCSPIILYDHPQIAAQSPGDLYDGTEIDEILTLRILTMTAAEKQEMAATDARARALLARTESLSQQQLLALHGVMRSPREAMPLRVGDQVRLRPRSGGDVLDIALAGQIALIEAIEVDFENRVHVAVTLNEDPGRDLGRERMPGHRFFFSPEEIESLSSAGQHR